MAQEAEVILTSGDREVRTLSSYNMTFWTGKGAGKGGKGGWDANAGKGGKGGYNSYGGKGGGWDDNNSYGGGYNSYGGKGGGGSYNSYGGGGKGQSNLASEVSSLKWMMEQKEWAEWETKTKLEQEEKARNEREVKETEAASRRQEMDSFKDLLRVQTESFTSIVTKSSTPTKGSPRDEPVSSKKRKAPIDIDSEEDEDDEDDYKKVLKKQTRKQQSLPPVKAAEWVEWECKPADAGAIKKVFKTTLKPGQMKERGLMEIAEAIEGEDGASDRSELAKLYQKAAGKTAPKRWAKVDIIVGIIASTVTKE